MTSIIIPSHWKYTFASLEYILHVFIIQPYFKATCNFTHFEKYHFKDLLEKQVCTTKLHGNKEKYCTKFTEDLKVNTFPGHNQVAPLFLTEKECQFTQNHNKRQRT